MCRNSHTSALISSIFSRVRGVGLDQQVVDLGGDRVRVLVDQRREHPGLADAVEDLGARLVAAGQDHPDRRAVRPGLDRPRRLLEQRRDLHPALAQREVGGGQGHDHVLPVAGHDDQRPGPDARQHVGRLHRADGDALDHPVEVPPRADTRPRTPSSTIPRVGFDRIGRYGSTPSSGIPWRASPRRSVSSIPGCSSTRTLFTIAPATGTPYA